MSQTYKSFADLAVAMGYKAKPKKAKEDKPIICNVCGAEMKKVPGTNIITCTGTVKKDGNESPCKRFILAHNVN